MLVGINHLDEGKVLLDCLDTKIIVRVDPDGIYTLILIAAMRISVVAQTPSRGSEAGHQW